MKHHLILRVVAKLLIPFILLFGLYVQFHGEYSPGGGFQAGVIFAAGFILHTLIFGIDATRAVLTVRALRVLASFGVLLYAGVGVVGILRGGEYLNYNVLAADPVEGQHLGILGIELGVGITVAAAILLIFYAFASRRD